MIVPNSIESHNSAAEIIRRGGVIAFRTDTFYGLGADPFNCESYRKDQRAERAGKTTSPSYSWSQMRAKSTDLLSNLSFFKLIAKGHWPAPLTLIGFARPEVPIELTAGTEKVSGFDCRMDDDVRSLVRACGGALTATSANVSGQPPARTAKEVENYFPTGIDLIIDGGEVAATSPRQSWI